MRLDTQNGALWLGYCTNVLPVEDLAALERVLLEIAAPLADRLAPDEPFGVGLHLTDRTTRDLLDSPERLRGFGEMLSRRRLVPFTVNAFPMGGFHAERVKDDVYRPDWIEDDRRLEHTLRVARVLATLLPENETGTISTLAGTYVPWGTDRREAEERFAARLVRVSEGLAELRAETGRRIVLCPEPEPLTTLETTEQVVAFWATLPRTPAVREHLALCFDCCHQAVEHEDVAASLDRLAAAGVPIGKVQLSNALEVDPDRAGAVDAIRSFDEPRYLHQTIAPDGRGGLARAADLPEVLADLPAWRERGPWRVHYHVPIERDAVPSLGTTRRDLEAAIRSTVDRGLCDHLEVETYTWSVLPEAERPRDEAGLRDGLERELRFARDLVEAGR